jgi:Pentapeptide repeats (8 copies)
MMDAFEPPKYLASLIAAANDGAKSAQTGALAFSLVGLYLLATAFSTTDEDLLLEHTMAVSQIGVQVPVVFSFAIAPAVFLFLHVYTLIRYDMLAANLHQFRIDLQTTVPVEADQERCRQLLTNVEFVQARTAPRGSTLHSRLYGLVAWLVLAGFPIATLIVVQISSLRYQSDTVTGTQQACIALDLMLLIWFFYRQRRREELFGNTSRFGWARYLVPSLFTAVVLVLDLLYLNVPGADEKTVRAGDDGAKWSEAHRQPLDLALCPELHWGCRYLTLDHRTLVGHVWNPQAIADLRAEQRGDIKKSLDAIEGVFVRDRTLRFANFGESRLYAADMVAVDLRHATLFDTQLQGIRLARANLLGVNLVGADLSGANLVVANLAEANLLGAILNGAKLNGAKLNGADLSGAYLNGAKLYGADLSGALVTQSQLDKACGNPATKVPPGLTAPHLCDR